jgi:hypothetical protein
MSTTNTDNNDASAAADKPAFSHGYCRDCATTGAHFIRHMDGDEPLHWYCTYCGSNHVDIYDAAGKVIASQGDLYPSDDWTPPQLKPRNAAIRPVFETYINPIAGAAFSHYEIQTVREFTDAHGETYFETVHDVDLCADDAENASGPVLFGIYGRHRDGGAEHLTDRADLAGARETLAKMIGDAFFK